MVNYERVTGVRIPDDRPKGWESSDGLSYWEHYARRQAAVHGGGNVPWWVGAAVVLVATIIACSLREWLSR